MPLSTTQYGYIIDPLVPLTDDTGRTISNGYVRVFMAGTSTPVITYKNFDGATNEETVQLDNSGRTAYPVIGSKGSTYKVCVYDAEHSQETPIKTIDKVIPTGASINASGATIVTGLDSVTVPEENFLKATVEGTGVELALDPTEVTSEVSTIGAAETAAPDYVVPLLDKTGTGDSKKISLANLFKFALDWISRLATTVTSFASGDFIAVSNPTNGARKMSKDTLLELTAQNALAGNVAPAFVPNVTETKAEQPYVYGGSLYEAKESGYQGPWDASKFEKKDVNYFLERLAESTSNCTVSLNGANMNTVYHDFLFATFNRVVINVSNPNWAVTSLVEGAKKLIIQAVLSNGTTTNIALYNRDNTVPSTIILFGDSFRRLGDVVGWRIFFRADVGQKVDFSIRYDCDQYFYAPMRQSFEMGNVTISSSSMTYLSSTTRMRTKKGEVYDFNAGDIIYCKSGYEFYLSLSSTGSAPYSPIGWITSYYFTTDTKCCCILVRKSGEATTTFDELFNSVAIHGDNCQLKPNNVEMIKDGDYDNSVLFGSVSNTLAGTNMNAVIQKYRCNPGVQLKVVLSKTDWAVTSLVENANKFCIRWVNSSGTASNLIAIGRDGWTSGVFIVTVPEGAVAVDVFFRGDIGETVSYTITDVSELTARKQPFANLTKAINHRGYNLEAPENTLPAFRLSEKKGFPYVETDVHACADGTLVCIHDSTVDRTSDGTGNVADMTIDELKALDFGSWFSAKYTGTKIPTLEEFLATCRDLGLKAYLEIKDLSNSSVENLVNLVNAYGMGSSVTYISFGLNYLQGVVAINKKARVGFLTGTLDSTAIAYAETLKTDENEVFIDAGVSAVNSTSIAIAKAAGMPVEIWTAYGNDVLNVNPYVSGFTSDSILASDWLYLKEYYKMS